MDIPPDRRLRSNVLWTEMDALNSTTDQKVRALHVPEPMVISGRSRGVVGTDFRRADPIRAGGQPHFKTGYPRKPSLGNYQGTGA
jgi:hypothetical protein